jgi:aminoglycoside 6'-N-acetyltransferase
MMADRAREGPARIREVLRRDGRDGDLLIRRMRPDAHDVDLIVRWRAEPHVHEFWDPDDPPPDREQIEREDLPSTVPGAPAIGCIAELGGRPVGYVQFYRWGDFADEAEEVGFEVSEDAWGIDVFVGEPDLVDRGVGSRIVRLTCEHLEEVHGAEEIVLLTEVINKRAQRAYEKAGFVKDGRVRDLDTRGGERVWSWVMRRRRGPGA